MPHVRRGGPRETLIMTSRRSVLALGAAALALWAARPPRIAAAAGFEVTRTEAEWRALLSPQAYAVLRESATERPWTSPLNDEHRAGIFACAGCALPLFSSETKFESGTGWPSFWAPLDNAVGTERGPRLRHGPHRGALPALRRPSRPRLRRRPAADRPALLHERRRARLPARRLRRFRDDHPSSALAALAARPCRRRARARPGRHPDPAAGARPARPPAAARPPISRAAASGASRACSSTSRA